MYFATKKERGLSTTTASAIRGERESMKISVPRMVTNPCEKLGKAHQQPIREGIHVRDHPGQNVSGGMRVQIFQGKGMKMGKGIIPQGADGLEGDAVIQARSEKLTSPGPTIPSTACPMRIGTYRVRATENRLNRGSAGSAEALCGRI